MEISMEIFLTAFSVIFSLLIVFLLVVIGKHSGHSGRLVSCHRVITSSGGKEHADSAARVSCFIR